MTATVAVPSDLSNVVVLDASYPIRLLENMDPGLTYIRDYEGIKQWHNVNVTLEAGSSGRGATTTTERIEKESPTEWAVRMVAERIPPLEPVLMLIFKDRPGEVEDDEEPQGRYKWGIPREEKQEDRFECAAAAAGLDVERFSYLTFGMETSRADFQHIKHVVFLGLLHRSDVDLTGAFIGQAGDMTTPITTKDVAKAQLTEIAHHVYQGLSRGSCRRMHNGEADAMSVWIRYRNPLALRTVLDPVLSGAQWHLPPPPAPAVAPVVDVVVERIATVLRTMKQDTWSLRKLKARVDPEGLIPSKSWKRAVQKALKLQDIENVWLRRKSSVYRAFEHHFGSESTSATNPVRVSRPKAQGGERRLREKGISA